MVFKRFMALLALAAGFLGVVACMLAVYPIWLVGFRLVRTNERVFVAVDKSLASAQDRVHRVQKRLRESKISTSEITQSLRDWSKSKAKERFMSTVETERRADKLAGHLQTAQQRLETATESIRGIQDVLELGAGVGAPVDAMSLEKVLEALTSIQDRLQETERSVNGIRELAVNQVGASEDNRLSRIFRLLSNTEVIAGAMDDRLEDSLARLSQVQADAQQWQARISHYILLTTLAGSMLLAWIAAGQAALCLCGWKTFRRNPSTA
jgi:hypothetical protein